jgi:heme a synthase
VVLILVFTTLVAGAFVAGTRAGYLDNTFPLMEGHVVPPDYWHLSPWYLNWFENLASVQFDHRVLAEVTWLTTAFLWLASLRERLSPLARLSLHALFFCACLQVALGISTLLLVVPLPLAVAHQAGALLLLTAALVVRHSLSPR